MIPILHRLHRAPTIEAAGRAWPVLFTHAVLLDIEAAAGLDILAGELDIIRPSARVLRFIVQIVLRAAGHEIGAQALGSLFGLGSLTKVRMALIDAWRISMPDRSEEPGDSKNQVRTWLEAWAIARHDLGLASEEWLAMTPRMVSALSRQRLEMLRQQEFMQSRIAAAAANFGGKGPKEPFKEDAFMLHPWPHRERQMQTGEDVLRMFMPYMDDRSKENIKSLVN